MQQTATEEKIPGGRFALVLGGLCLLLFAGATAAAWWDNQHRNWLESAEIVPMPDEDQPLFFPMPPNLQAGAEIARMDSRPLYLTSMAAVSYPDEEVLAVGIEDQRVYPIYQLRVQPEDKPNPLLLRISPETYLCVRDRLEPE